MTATENPHFVLDGRQFVYDYPDFLIDGEEHDHHIVYEELQANATLVAEYQFNDLITEDQLKPVKEHYEDDFWQADQDEEADGSPNYFPRLNGRAEVYQTDTGLVGAWIIENYLADMYGIVIPSDPEKLLEEVKAEFIENYMAYVAEEIADSTRRKYARCYPDQQDYARAKLIEIAIKFLVDEDEQHQPEDRLTLAVESCAEWIGESWDNSDQEEDFDWDEEEDED